MKTQELFLNADFEKGRRNIITELLTLCLTAKPETTLYRYSATADSVTAPSKLLLVGYLTMLSVSRQHSIKDIMINPLKTEFLLNNI
jgi:hypothetical protein